MAMGTMQLNIVKWLEENVDVPQLSVKALDLIEDIEYGFEDGYRRVWVRDIVSSGAGQHAMAEFMEAMGKTYTEAVTTKRVLHDFEKYAHTLEHELNKRKPESVRGVFLVDQHEADSSICIFYQEAEPLEL